jgi:hypothetical protein
MDRSTFACGSLVDNPASAAHDLVTIDNQVIVFNLLAVEVSLEAASSVVGIVLLGVDLDYHRMA